MSSSSMKDSDGSFPAPKLQKNQMPHFLSATSWPCARGLEESPLFSRIVELRTKIADT